MEKHVKLSREYFLSIQCVPSMNNTCVFICGVSPSEYNYTSALLQRLYSQNISGRIRNFPKTSLVRYSLDGPRCFRQPSSRRSSSSCSSWTFLPPPTGLHAILGCLDEGPGVLRSLSASMLALSRLRMSSASVPKIGVLSARPWPWLQYTCSLVLALLRRPDRRWCPQH